MFLFSTNMNSKRDNIPISIELLYHWNDLIKRPKVIVFDLDHTLWNFYIDYDRKPPLRKLADKRVVDSNGKCLDFFPQVIQILNTLKTECFNNGNVKLAIASRAQQFQVAFDALNLLECHSYFDSVQIYSCPKNVHLYAIRDDLKLKTDDFSDFLFFDDNKYNINVAREFGICSILVDKKRGLDIDYINYGLDVFEKS